MELKHQYSQNNCAHLIGIYSLGHDCGHAACRVYTRFHKTWIMAKDGIEYMLCPHHLFSCCLGVSPGNHHTSRWRHRSATRSPPPGQQSFWEHTTAQRKPRRQLNNDVTDICPMLLIPIHALITSVSVMWSFSCRHFRWTPYCQSIRYMILVIRHCMELLYRYED